MVDKRTEEVEGSGEQKEGQIDWQSKYTEAMDDNENLKKKLLYLHAELDNFRKRKEKEKTEWLKYGNMEFVRSILSIVDHLEAAIKHAKERREKQDLSIIAGIELSLRDTEGVLAKFGVKPIVCLGKPFDPMVHEAVEQRKSESPSNTVIEEYRKGFMMYERLLRPSQVVVAVSPEQGDPKSTNDKNK